LLEAMREAHPQTVRQFFVLANQHVRRELNHLARRSDELLSAMELREETVPAPASSASGLKPTVRRMLEAIENLPGDEREAFSLVRVRGRVLSRSPTTASGLQMQTGRRGDARRARKGHQTHESTQCSYTQVVDT
jgi:hypothetical protein